MTSLTKSIRQWVRARNIHTAEPTAQMGKVTEETGELAGALLRGNEEETKDAIGDVFVTLVSVCETLGFDMTECVAQAYDEIKDRKGRLVDGVFIKDE